MARSLLIKFAMLAVTALLIVWIGWPPPQSSETDSDEPAAQPLSSVPETSGGNPINQSAGAGRQPRPDRAQSDGRMDLNRAGIEELERLPGIGNVLARRIVEWRSTRGRFRSVEELARVKGIGAKKLARIKPLIRVSSTKSAGADAPAVTRNRGTL